MKKRTDSHLVAQGSKTRDLEESESRAERIIAVVCHSLQLDRARIYSRTRDQYTVQARQLVCYVLYNAGYTMPRIGALIERDHTTVVHALQQVEQSPMLLLRGQQLVQQALPLVEDIDSLDTPPPDQMIARVLLRALTVCGEREDAPAVQAYVLGTMLGRERVEHTHAAWGLHVIATRPRVRVAVETALAACGLSAYFGLIDLQLQQVGVRT